MNTKPQQDQTDSQTPWFSPLPPREEKTSSIWRHVGDWAWLMKDGWREAWESDLRPWLKETPIILGAAAVMVAFTVTFPLWVVPFSILRRRRARNR